MPKLIRCLVCPPDPYTGERQQMISFNDGWLKCPKCNHEDIRYKKEVKMLRSQNESRTTGS